MKIKKILVLTSVLIFFMFSAVSVKADGYGDLYEIIPEEAKKVMKEMDIYSIDTDTAVKFSASDMVVALIPNIEKSVKETISSMKGIGCILLISALINILKRNDASNKTYDTAAAAVCAVCVTVPVSRMIISVVTVIKTLTNFMLGYIPVYTGLIIASGFPTTAAGYSSALLTVSELFAQFADKLMLPSVGMILGLSALSGINSNEIFSKLPATAKHLTQWVFAAAVSLFVCLLSAQTVISSASDSLLLKSGKMFAGFVPVVGASLSDAFSVTVGSMSVIKSGVGIFGVITILILFIPHLFKLIIWAGTVKLIASASDTLGTQGMKRVLSGVGDTINILLAVYVSFGVISVISTAVMIKTAT